MSGAFALPMVTMDSADTCIVIDVLESDPSFGVRSATLLEQKLDEGLSICPVTLVELVPALEGNLDEQECFLQP